MSTPSTEIGSCAATAGAATLRPRWPPVESLLALFLHLVGGDPVSHLDEALARRRTDPALAADEVGLVTAAGALVARLAAGQ